MNEIRKEQEEDNRKLDYIVNILYEYIYDPWTDDTVTHDSIKKDLDEIPLDIIYTLCARVKELVDD